LTKSDKWDKKEERKTSFTKYFNYLDLTWLARRNTKKHRILANIMLWNGLVFIVINVASIVNYGLWWLYYGNRVLSGY